MQAPAPVEMLFRSCVYACACLLLISIAQEGLAAEMYKPDVEDAMEYQVADELDTGSDPGDNRFSDAETESPADYLMDRLIKNQLRNYLSFDIYRNEWETPWPLLQELPMKRGFRADGTKTAPKIRQLGEKAPGNTNSYRQRRWKTKKGRGNKGSGQMLCYFKLCAFRPTQ